MLDDISIFVYLVECGSFYKVSEQLNLSQATISRRIAKLEKCLNTLLFIRDTRNMTLTDEGLMLYNKFKTINKDLDNYIFESKTKNNRNHETTKKTLTICLHSTIAYELICPYLKQYTQQFPHVLLNLVFYAVDLINDIDFDIGVSNRIIENSKYITKTIRNDSVKLYCPPQYLINNEMPRTLDELKKHSIIGGLENTNNVLNEIKSTAFINKYTHEKTHYEVQISQIRTNSAAHAKRIGLLSNTIFFCWESLCEQDVLEGKLIPILPEYEIETNNCFYILYKQNLSYEENMFCEFIYNCMKRTIQP